MRGTDHGDRGKKLSGVSGQALENLTNPFVKEIHEKEALMKGSVPSDSI